jgi:hypothetical protein
MGSLCIATLVFAAAPLRAQTNLEVYDDALESGFQNWSWATTNLQSTAVVHSGQFSIAVDTGPYQGLSIQDPAGFSTVGYGNLTFWINGGPTGGQVLNVQGTVSNSPESGAVIGPLAANTWVQETIPLASLGVGNISNCSGFWVQEWAGKTQPTYYVDDIVITGSQPTIPPPSLNGMALYIDSFTSGWQNWSWATVNAANTNPVHTGSSSIAVTAGAFQALYFEHQSMSTQPYTSLTFWINGGSTGGQNIQLMGLLNYVQQSSNAVKLGPIAPNKWTEVTIPLSKLGVDNQPDLTGFWFQEDEGKTLPTFFVDDVRLNFAAAPSSVNVTVDNSDNVHLVDPRMFALNTAIWDGDFAQPSTVNVLNADQIRALRFPGGSASDEYHWATNLSDGSSVQWATDFDSFESTAQQVTPVPQVYITANYGSGTPAEAAAWVQDANVTHHWGVKYWEIGNEMYGSWENDTNNRPHDPVTYANRFVQFWTAMKAIDPTIKIGAVAVTGEDSFANYSDEVVTNPRTGETHSGWTPVLLATLAQLGVTPDYLIYHRYEQNPGQENDTALLTSAVTWPNDAADLRQQLSDYLGAAGAGVELDCTENNSVSSNPGKQTTSLVNGLYLADSLGNILQTEFNSLVWWDLRNGPENGNNNSPLLYGWRNYGDYGTVAGGSAGLLLPSTLYPTAEVGQLLTHFARGGEEVVGATSNYWGLGAYAVRGTDNTLRVMLINKNSSATLSANINLQNWGASFSQITAYQYGKTQDNAAMAGTGNQSPTKTTVAASGPTFTYRAPPYSVTVLVIP